MGAVDHTSSGAVPAAVGAGDDTICGLQQLRHDVARHDVHRLPVRWQRWCAALICARAPCRASLVSPRAATAADMQVVHFTQQIPHSLVGLVIGVKGASIHAVEVASQCHLSLDRGCVFTDPGDSVPYVLLHIHGQRCGAWPRRNFSFFF